MPDDRSRRVDSAVSTVLVARMGEIVVAANGESIRTLLGSCVGVALFDAERRVGGLAHVVLPASSGGDGPPGKFVDTAIPELVRRIVESGGRASCLCAKLAGGARMFRVNTKLSIGDQNLRAAENMLASQKIPVVGRHCGGEQGRRMILASSTGDVRIEVVGENAIAI